MKDKIFLGFSFCGDVFGIHWGCIPRIQEEMTDDLYSGLFQFFQLFPEFQLNPFYVFGESYGAKFAILIAKKIHDNNQRSKVLEVIFLLRINIIWRFSFCVLI